MSKLTEEQVSSLRHELDLIDYQIDRLARYDLVNEHGQQRHLVCNLLQDAADIIIEMLEG